MGSSSAFSDGSEGFATMSSSQFLEQFSEFTIFSKFYFWQGSRGIGQSLHSVQLTPGAWSGSSFRFWSCVVK